MEVYCIVNETKTIEATTKKIDLAEPLAYNNAYAHAFRVTIHNDDESEANLTGIGVSGTFLKANDEAVDPIVGSVINGEGGNPCIAQIILPPSCYVQPGRFKFTMNLTKSGGYARTVQWVEGRVEKNTSSTIIDPGTPVTNYSTIIANANAAAAAATQAAEEAEQAAASVPEVKSAIAPDYSDLSFPIDAYMQHCWHDGHFYINTVDIPSAEAWTASHWLETDMDTDIADLKYRLGQLITDDVNGLLITL